MTTPDLFRRIAPTPGTTDRTLWSGVACVVAGVLLALGFLYLLGGLTVAADDRAYEVVRILPGGMRTHGALMVTLGALLLGSLAGMRHTGDADLARRTLYLTCGYSVWIVYAFVAAGVDLHAKIGAPVVWWLAGVSLNALLVWRRPHATRRGRHDGRRGSSVSR